jgi:tetrahydromethanopterin S-methyltransferase subunit B
VSEYFAASHRDELLGENRKLKERIKRLESVTNDPHALWANWLRGDVKLPEGIGDVREYQDRIKRLEEAVEAYRTAYTPDGHVAPHDCFATGPKTGNPIEDLVACPGCWAERKAKEAKL